MRIAVIGTRGKAGPAREAIDKALGEICPRLAERGHDIDVFSERNGRGLDPVAGTRLIRLPHVPLSRGHAASHAALSSLVSLCRGYDVVNFFAAESEGLYSGAARLGRHRVVVSVLGLEHPSPRRGPEHMAARFADAVTVSSRRLERLFRDTYGREAIFIPNGIACPSMPADTRLLQPLGLASGGFLLLADRLMPASGARLALDALEALGWPLPLVVAETSPGDEDYGRELRQAAPSGRVRFLGQVAEPLLEALMAHAYLSIQPSEADEVPPTLLTSLARGSAVVVSDLPEHVEVTGGHGFTFTAGDLGDLQRVLAWLLADPDEVARMGKRGASTVSSRYGWDRIADTYEQVYSALLQIQPPG